MRFLDLKYDFHKMEVCQDWNLKRIGNACVWRGGRCFPMKLKYTLEFAVSGKYWQVHGKCKNIWRHVTDSKVYT